MFTYQAPNPYPERSSFFSFLSGLPSSSQSIGGLVLPAQWRPPTKLSDGKLASMVQGYNVVVEGGHVGTHDGAILDTIEVNSLGDASSPVNTRHYIIKFNGNGMQYEDAVSSYARDANRLDASVIGFNYRGVGNSKKTPDTFQDLVTDGIAQVQRLLDKGVDSKKITLDGLSLGGGVATMVAAHFHQLGKPVYLWNDRSFASISKAAAGMVAPESEGIFGNAFGTSLETSSWSVMAPAGWDANVAKTYNSIPVEYKGHMYVAKKSNKSYGDGVIAHRASLHRGVKPYEKTYGLKTGHKVYAQSRMFGGGHNMQRSDLVSAEDQRLSGQDVFESFVRSHRPSH